LLTILALVLTAQAQELVAIDADPFDPASGLIHTTGTIQGESPVLMGEGMSMGLYGNIAEDLVVLGFADGREEPVVSELFGTTLYGGYTYQDLFRVDVFLPVYVYAEAPLAPFRGPAMGDVKIQGVIPVYQYGDDGLFEFSVAPAFSLPTGTKRALLHRGVHGQIDLLAGGEYEGFGYLANIGMTFAPTDSLGPVRMGSTFDTVMGAYYRVDDSFRVGGDLDMHVGLAGGDIEEFANSLATGHLFVQTIGNQGITGTVGAGTGLWAGVGAPEYRVFAGVGYAPLVADKDKDGLNDDEDMCPLEAEDVDEFQDDDGCPDTDNDSDGLVDSVDRCPDDAEDMDEFDDGDGCPDPDNDMDDVLDVDDACPLEPGTVELNGCAKPPDSDDDGVLDDVDECPDVPGPVEIYGCPDTDSDLVPDFRDKCPDEPRPDGEDLAYSDGCPKRVFYTGTELKITDKVQFGSGSSRLAASSFGLLNEVADLLKANKWIKKIEIQGHTDGQGSNAGNLSLSQRRAESVKTYMQGRGIPAALLVAKGYGEEKPISSNRTSIGREKNRRVEFAVLKQSKPPALNKAPQEAPPEAPEAPAEEGTDAPIDTAPAEPATPEAPTDGAPEGAAEETVPTAIEPDGDAPAAEGSETPDAPAKGDGTEAPAEDGAEAEPSQGDFDALFDAAFGDAESEGTLAPPPGEEKSKKSSRKSRKKPKKGKGKAQLPPPDDGGMLTDEDFEGSEPAPWDDPEGPRTGEEAGGDDPPASPDAPPEGGDPAPSEEGEPAPPWDEPEQ